MLYNNPIAYKTDFLPEQIDELAARAPQPARGQGIERRRAPRHRDPALVRRPAAQILVGVDDVMVEGVARRRGRLDRAAWSTRFPRESVALFHAATRRRSAGGVALYRWFLPLLRMDTVVKFVQLIKLVQQESAWGASASARRACRCTARSCAKRQRHRSRACDTSATYGGESSVRQSGLGNAEHES